MPEFITIQNDGEAESKLPITAEVSIDVMRLLSSRSPDKAKIFTGSDRAILARNGIEIVQEKPAVLRDKLGGTATGIMALYVLAYLTMEDREEKMLRRNYGNT